LKLIEKDKQIMLAKINKIYKSLSKKEECQLSSKIKLIMNKSMKDAKN